MEIKITTAETFNINYTATMQEVCKLLHWDEQQFADRRFENGIAYIQWYLPVDDRGRATLRASKIFWSWFKGISMKCDDEFIKQVATEYMTVGERRECYAAAHNPHSLAVDCKPNSVVLNELKKQHT